MPNILVSRFIFPLGDKVFAKGVKEFEMSPYWYQDFKIIGWNTNSVRAKRSLTKHKTTNQPKNSGLKLSHCCKELLTQMVERLLPNKRSSV